MSIGEIILNILTIVAIIIGPIAAVRITRNLDEKREEQGRRMDVFRTLMRTRRVTLSPDHVGALNLVEIEFKDEGPVIAAWRQYFENLGERWPDDLKMPEIEERTRRRAGLLTKLLHAMANSLNFTIEQLEIFEGGYAPQGWQDEEETQRALRYNLLQVLTGKRAFPVTSINQPIASQAPPPNPFPPPPE